MITIQKIFTCQLLFLLALNTHSLRAQECGPNSTGDGCLATTCAEPSEFCLPSAYTCVPGGACTVFDCDCAGTSECRAQEVGGVVTCVGTCSTGSCNLSAFDTNGDDIDDYFTCGCEILQACCVGQSGCSIEFPSTCLAMGGAPQGVGSVCLGDGDMNGVDDLCDANCMQEVCDGVDNDCDGVADEDFTIFGVDQNTGDVVDDLPIGAVCVSGEGECEGVGVVVCSQDGLSAICDAVELTPGTEGPANDPSCFNYADDDCDGLYDYEDPDCMMVEICDSLDNDDDGLVDEDFIGLGDDCVVGQGVCVSPGILICSDDGTHVVCSATPLPPGQEGPPQSIPCQDGLDNDCDGLIDMNDPDCQQPEICDGIDNDGDNLVDEDFAQLGDPCSVGTGVCANSGVIVCNTAGDGTTCSASPKRAFPEGPAGCSCADGIDNDCDGLIDIDDPDCGSSRLRARVSLDPECGPIGNDCESWHVVNFNAVDGNQNTVVIAEVLALDENDNVQASIPIEQGDRVRLRASQVGFEADTVVATIDLQLLQQWDACVTGPGSGPIGAACGVLNTDCDKDIDAVDFMKHQLQFGQQIKYHTIESDLPLIKVTADDGSNRVHAYASNIPYAQVVEPKDTTVNLSEGNTTRVEAAIPNMDPASLRIRVDGIDILAAIGVDPATDFPGGPFGGHVMVDGCTVSICDLVVDSAPMADSAANTVSFYAEGLCCGGHRFVVEGEKRNGSYPDTPETGCHVDDLYAFGDSHGFEVRVFSPVDGAITAGHPTLVTGEVCHGRDYCFISDGCTQEICGQGTVDCLPHVRVNGYEFAVSDRIVEPGDGVNTADTYRYPFSTVRPETDLVQDFAGMSEPGTIDPGANRLVVEAFDDTYHSTFDNVNFSVGPIQNAPMGGSPLASSSAEVSKGVNLTMTEYGLAKAVSTILDDTVPDLMDQEIRKWIDEMNGFEYPVELTNYCIPTIKLTVDPSTLEFDKEAFSYGVWPDNAYLDVQVSLPSIRAELRAEGGCRVKVCAAGNPNLCVCALGVDLDVTLAMEITEVKVRFKIHQSELLNTITVEPEIVFDTNKIFVNDIVENNIRIKCFLGFVLDTLIVSPPIQAWLENKLTKYIGPNGEINLGNWGSVIDPKQQIKMTLFKLSDLQLPAFDLKLGFEREFSDFSHEGVVLGYATTFTPTQVDPDAPEFPGSPKTVAPLPQPSLPNIDELTASISDDAFNQMLHSLAVSGKFQTSFEDVRLVDDLLPADCDVLATPGDRGRCKAVKGIDCQTLPADEIDPCEPMAAIFASMNVSSQTQVILHGRLHSPPKIFLTDDLNTPEVEAMMRLQVVVGVIADRDDNGTTHEEYGTLPECFGGNAATTEDCSVWESCLDINVAIDVTLVNGNEIHVATSNRVLSNGVQCDGGTQSIIEGMVANTAIGLTVDLIEQTLNDAIPPLTLEGLDFDGLVTIANPKLIVIENDGHPEFGDYLGITGSLDLGN